MPLSLFNNKQTTACQFIKIMSHIAQLALRIMCHHNMKG